MDYEVCIETGNDKNTLYLSTDYPPIINKLQKLIRSNPVISLSRATPKQMTAACTSRCPQSTCLSASRSAYISRAT